MGQPRGLDVARLASRHVTSAVEHMHVFVPRARWSWCMWFGNVSMFAYEDGMGSPHSTTTCEYANDNDRANVSLVAHVCIVGVH